MNSLNYMVKLCHIGRGKYYGICVIGYASIYGARWRTVACDKWGVGMWSSNCDKLSHYKPTQAMACGQR